MVAISPCFIAARPRVLSRDPLLSSEKTKQRHQRRNVRTSYAQQISDLGLRGIGAFDKRKKRTRSGGGFQAFFFPKQGFRFL